MLRTRVVATGEVNVNGLIEFDLRLKILAENDGLAFGVCSREFASSVAGAGDESARDGCRGVSEACSFDGSLSIC